MHLGRFSRAIELLAEESAQKNNPISLIQQLITAIDQVAANPTSPEHAIAYKTILETCHTSLEASKLNQVRPILHSIFESINATSYFGIALFERIKEAINSNQATPTLASLALSKLYQEVNFFYQQIDAINTAFKNLKVEHDELKEGESEIGLLVPRGPDESTLKDLSKEFQQWNNILSQVANIFDENHPLLQIKNCSTTDWMIYIASTPPVLYGISLCVKGVNQILSDLISTRSLIEQLASKPVSEAAISTLRKETEDGFDTNIRALAEKIVDENSKQTDEGIKNETKNGLNIALKSLARKIDREN